MTDIADVLSRISRGQEVTRQEIFDVSVLGVLKQGRLAMQGRGCFYRTDDGAKCAAGQLIPDDLYDPSMEGGLIHELLSGLAPTHPIVKSLGRHEGLIAELQSAHDDANSLDGGEMYGFIERARRAASILGVSDACLGWEK